MNIMTAFSLGYGNLENNTMEEFLKLIRN